MISNENYFSPENNMKYMGASQFKDFMKCESMAMAKIRGEFQQEKTVALLMGSFLDAHFSNELSLFKAQNPEIFTTKGELKSTYEHAVRVIQRIEQDDMMMSYINGAMQVILTGFIAGVPFKIKIDALHPDKIVDMKFMKDFNPIWVDGEGKVSFVEAWGYDIQGAIYQTVEQQNRPFFAEPLPFIIAGATKEKEPDIELISIPQQQIDFKLQIVEENAPRFDLIKKGMIEPKACGKCDWCKSQKKITRVVDYREIGGNQIE